MMRITSSCCSSSTRGNSVLHPTTTVVVFISRTSRAFHSQPSDPARSRETHRGDLVRNPHPPSVPRVRDLEHALNVFDEMLQRRPLPSVVRFTQILTQVSRLKHYSDVISLSKQMIQCGFVLKNRIPEAAEIFSKMLQGGPCMPNGVTFNTLVKGLCLRGDTCAAIQLLRKMEERGCQPNLVSYSTIIDRDAVTYNSLIKGVCDRGQFEEATRLLYEMKSRNIYADVFTFNIFVDGLCKEGKVVKAKRVVEIMIDKGLEPDLITYNSLMNGYCLRGEMGEARKVFDLMLGKGRMVDVWSCNILINGYCCDKTIDLANDVFQDMLRLELRPNTVATLFLMVFVKRGGC